VTVGAPRDSTRGGYRTVNRVAWDALAAAGSDSSQPCSPAELAEAAEWVCPDEWLPWPEIRTVLCLASGGGQQAPAFAMLGYDVTVVDLSPEQLSRDDAVASALGLQIECVEGDMLDLSMLGARRFDLVYQPISSCYVPDVERLYQQVAGVLEPGGWYDVEHWNPVHVQLTGLGEWDGGAYVIDRPQGGGRPSIWTSGESDEQIMCWHYTHRLHDLIGGLGRNGFTIHRLRERPTGDPAAAPGSHDHLSAYFPAFFRILARFGRPA
jgi:SAM-dependent methyltransferase